MRGQHVDAEDRRFRDRQHALWRLGTGGGLEGPFRHGDHRHAGGARAIEQHCRARHGACTLCSQDSVDR